MLPAQHIKRLSWSLGLASAGARRGQESFASKSTSCAAPPTRFIGAGFVAGLRSRSLRCWHVGVSGRRSGPAAGGMQAEIINGSDAIHRHAVGEGGPGFSCRVRGGGGRRRQLCLVCVCRSGRGVSVVWCATVKTPCVDSKRPRVYRHHARMW